MTLDEVRQKVDQIKATASPRGGEIAEELFTEIALLRGGLFAVRDMVEKCVTGDECVQNVIDYIRDVLMGRQ